MAFQIPIFPLNVVLFPGMQLPLHVFEPRYRRMIQRCFRSGESELDRTFGVALLQAGREGESETLPVMCGTTAFISQVAPLPDGRFNLMTDGQRRFQILDLETVDEYFVATADWQDDEPCFPVELEAEAERVRGVLESYLRAISQTAGSLASELGQLDIPENSLDLSMWIGALLPLAPHQKQPLLETTSTIARLQTEYSLLRQAEVIQRAYSQRSEVLRQLADPNAAERLASLN